MTQAQKSIQNGVLSAGMTENPPALPSTNAASQSTSGTLGSEAPESPNFQPTPNSQDERENPNLTHGRLIQAFAGKLGELVEWRKMRLKDGRTVYALCFPTDRWEVDGVSKELRPR